MDNCNLQTASSFLRKLPLEIRIEVYRNLLSTEYTKRISIARQIPYHARLWPGHVYRLDPTILQVCRQAHREASAVLYGENLFVRIRSTLKNLRGLMDVKGIPVFLQGRKAESFRHCAMSVDFDRRNAKPRLRTQGGNDNDNSSNHYPCYVIAASDVELLCQTLLIQHTVMTTNTFNLGEFNITIHRLCDDMLSPNPARHSPQRRLLEPFTTLHSVPHFRIAGPANTAYCALITAHVARPGPTIDDSFAAVMRLRDHAFRNNDPKRAMPLLKAAYAHLITTCLRRNVVAAEWAGAHHPALMGAIVDAYVGLAAHLAVQHYRCGDMGDAHFWARDALRYASPRFLAARTDNFYAKLVYLCAIASARAGAVERAVEELCQGLGCVGREAYRDRGLVTMRREARWWIRGMGGVRVLKAMGIGYL